MRWRLTFVSLWRKGVYPDAIYFTGSRIAAAHARLAAGAAEGRVKLHEDEFYEGALLHIHIKHMNLMYI